MSRLRVGIELPVHGVGFAELRALAAAAEAAGLDAVWVPDHLVPLHAGARNRSKVRCSKWADVMW